MHEGVLDHECNKWDKLNAQFGFFKWPNIKCTFTLTVF